MNVREQSYRTAIEEEQLIRLNRLLLSLRDANEFYKKKFTEARLKIPASSLHEFKHAMPFTTKAELLENQALHPPYGTNLTEPLERYTRYHQTSGTSSVPLRWLDTPESWGWVVSNWRQVYQAAGITAGDTVFFAFSFGPFLGFWSAMDAAQQIGCLCIPGGGMSSAARLLSMRDNHATVLCCTPTYAMRLAAVARQESIPMESLAVRTLIVAGEPGGSLPAVRRSIETAWRGARVFDHHGMTEVGPVSFESPGHPGVLHVIEGSYLAEAIHPETAEPVSEGERGELVLTTLGRSASPLIRYHTGDWVQPSWHGAAEFGRPELALIGGILGRLDDMVLIRGVNVFPGLIEETIRSCDGIAEYRVLLEDRDTLTELSIQIEMIDDVDGEAAARHIESELRKILHLRVPVQVVNSGSLPVFEMKAKRWIRSP